MSTEQPQRRQFLRSAGIVVLAGLLAVAAYEVVTAGQMKTFADTRKLLGADAEVKAVVHDGDERRAKEAVRQAMNEIEQIDALVSTESRSGSELSQLILAKLGQFVPLSPATLDIIDQAGAPQWLMMLPAGAVKQADAGTLDLSQAAREYAAKQAIDAMRQTGITGATVKIGTAFEQFGQQ